MPVIFGVIFNSQFSIFLEFKENFQNCYLFLGYLWIDAGPYSV